MRTTRSNQCPPATVSSQQFEHLPKCIAADLVAQAYPRTTAKRNLDDALAISPLRPTGKAATLWGRPHWRLSRTPKHNYLRDNRVSQLDTLKAEAHIKDPRLGKSCARLLGGPVARFGEIGR